MTDEQLTTDLEAHISSLRNRCRKAGNSPTAAETAAYLSRLERDPNLSVAEKLAAVRQAARELSDALRYSEPIRGGFNVGPNMNPRPPRNRE